MTNKRTKPRRIHLTAGRSPTLSTIGASSPDLVLHGRTAGGAEYAILLEVGDYALAMLALSIKRHFKALAESEDSHRKSRERAFVAHLRERNAQLHIALTRAEAELERLKSLADLERINPIRYRNESLP